jgi:AmmeMemoRadiSam system protein B
VIPDAHSQEHSIEIQLPFLQVVLGDFSFVPVLMGTQHEQECRELAAAVAGAVQGKDALIVGSSDLSHFRRDEDAVTLDSRVLDYIETMDAAGLLKAVDRGFCEACGSGAIATAMMTAAAMGADRSQVLQYAHSGDVSGDTRSVVGYAAAVFYAAGAEE